jgi:hypothetical protein
MPTSTSPARSETLQQQQQLFLRRAVNGLDAGFKIQGDEARNPHDWTLSFDPNKGFTVANNKKQVRLEGQTMQQLFEQIQLFRVS